MCSLIRVQPRETLYLSRLATTEDTGDTEENNVSYSPPCPPCPPWWRVLRMTPDQIQKREQENPDDVDEVPVQTADLDRAVVLRGDRAAPRPPQHPRHDPEPDDHVQRVQARHDEVEREENLRVPRVLVRLEREARTGHVMLVELVARDREGAGIPRAIDRVNQEEAAEEQHFGRQKHPHPERGRFLLLREVVEVMRERRMMVMNRFRQRDPPRPPRGTRTGPR